MLGEGRLKQLHAFIEGYTKEELVWLNGYLSGLVAGERGHGNTTVPAITTVKKITLVYGTETGNSRKLAAQLAAVAKKRGVIVKLSDLGQYRLTDITKEDYFFIVISTQGEGEPPVSAKKFYDHIHASDLSLPGLRYSVLALGDSSYPLFCKTGEEVDERLRSFGATRIIPVQKCDVDYEEDAANWFDKVLAAVDQPTTAIPAIQASPKKAKGKKYYSGTVITNINLNDHGSSKATYHLEIATEEKIEYEPGDTIGIVPSNRVQIVEKIIALTSIDPLLEIQTTKITAPVADLLTHHLGICYLLTSTVKKYAAIIDQEIPGTRMDLMDLLRIYPVKDAAQFEEVIKVLMPIAPRLYSVSSSPAAHGENEIHITVAKDQFLAQDEQKFGLCSEFLGDLPLNSSITFYVHKDKNFKLPATDKDVIMIGPGSGIAPFRSFLAERNATGATGRNWLFFGEQHFTTDFLYQSEMQSYVQTNVLAHIDLAFSRDQAKKIYVQDRMQAKSVELYEWISNGAYLYISGKKDPMGVDVESALIEIFAVQGKKTSEEAKAFLEQLKKEGRYEKDVY